MKNKTQYIKTALLLIITTVSASCKKDFLDVIPKGKLIAQTVTDYDLMLNNNALTSGGGGFTSGNDVSVPLGDEVVAVENYFTSAPLRSQRLFRYEDIVYNNGESAQELTDNMGNIYIYNKIINEVMAATGGTPEQKKALLAEARAARAWQYLLLINYYGKPYHEATSVTDPGVPIVIQADVTATKFERASVKAVYDFILKDLTEAIPDLPVTIKSRIRMGRAAAEGLLAKVYVYMAKFPEAKAQLDAAINDLPLTGAVGGTTTTMGLYDLNITMVPGGTWGYNPAITAASFFSGSPLLPNYTENLFARQFINFWSFTSNEYLLSPQAAALFSPSDKRLNFFSARPYGASTNYNLPGALRRNGPTSTYFGVQIPDLYLLRAECRARLNDLSGAKADLEILRTKRMNATEANVSASLTQIQMIRFVLEERIREFALQGYRWFDMRRLSVDPLFSGDVFSHQLYSQTGAVTTTFPLRKERFVLRFAQKVMDENPGMVNNP